MPRIVADIGNSRLKWALLDEHGASGPSVSLPLDDPKVWGVVLDGWLRPATGPATWAVSSVNPPLAARLGAFLADRGVAEVRWFLTAAEVPVAKDVEGAETGGADRALAVLAASRLLGPGRPILVVSCGTAITIERITPGGVWQGGAIAMGMGLCARALHHFTAQLPLVDPGRCAPSWGRSTVPSLEAGVFWGSVGAVRELLARQAVDLGAAPLVVWTGGDAFRLAPAVEGPAARVIPDLVLQGLVHAAFPSEP
ncbi:type III pantothenate kinase [Planctomyces sp. SH-PL62]|uniref:type III pantothenate kinase n=1 Tax=Planctomyces sp. SH-PL62 TaxID=1636152 RepID=UPI00078EEFB7|nr:type III pantothenate kinase [Planctomyces sp. SH-PL62]AMV37545.1 Type III pantothenate kinase [Planctomyces sp. SH-PL62]